MFPLDIGKKEKAEAALQAGIQEATKPSEYIPPLVNLFTSMGENLSSSIGVCFTHVFKLLIVPKLLGWTLDLFSGKAKRMMRKFLNR